MTVLYVWERSHRAKLVEDTVTGDIVRLADDAGTMRDWEVTQFGHEAGRRFWKLKAIT